MSPLDIFLGGSVLVTGHTGFKGSWLISWLHNLGADVTGVALEKPPSSPSHFEVAGLSNLVSDHRVNICNTEMLKKLVLETQPDFVFHLAAQPLVHQSYANPLETYQTNVIGTLNVLEALRTLKKSCVAVLITSDKCYDNVEWVWGYRESDPLGGTDPYSASKGAAEFVIRSHVKSFFPESSPVRIGVGRAGNVIGGGDWAKDRIVPDCIRAWAKGETLQVRNPHATRPWQHVLEPLSGYLHLASRLYYQSELHGEPFNFGPSAFQDYTTQELVSTMSQYWPDTQWETVSQPRTVPRESGLLKLNCEKALKLLDWQAILSFKDTVRMTVEWYKAYYANPPAIGEVTSEQIRTYQSIVQS